MSEFLTDLEKTQCTNTWRWLEIVSFFLPISSHQDIFGPKVKGFNEEVGFLKGGEYR